MTTPSNFTGGALDLGALKQQAEAREKDAQAGVAAFFEVTDDNFEVDLVRRSAQVPVIALIGTARSSQSEQLKKDFSELAAAGNSAFVVGYIDADAYPQLVQPFGVKNLPTVVALAAGQPVTSFEGAQPREALGQWVAALVEQLGSKLSGLPAAEPEEEKLDPRVQQAEEALNAGDFDGAIAVYDAILKQDPHAVDITQARDTTRLLKRLSGVEDPLGVAESDDSPQAQMDAADAEIVAGAPEKAFHRLIEAMKLAAPEDKKVLRERLLELFGLFDRADERVLNARRALASALY